MYSKQSPQYHFAARQTSYHRFLTKLLLALCIPAKPYEATSHDSNGMVSECVFFAQLNPLYPCDACALFPDVDAGKERLRGYLHNCNILIHRADAYGLSINADGIPVRVSR